MQKLYCYVDETGQDPTSEFFIVVAVVIQTEQELIKKKLETLERLAGTNRKKWHKVRPENRMHYLALLLEQKIAAGEISEPLIRLADMWAGCIRSALLQQKNAKNMFERAKIVSLVFGIWFYTGWPRIWQKPRFIYN